ncbi:hypothetical protein KH5H1_49370 [Corallococcus caeni]|nr:hypothetical protein KH5H1_49370 [Corallococcus sp. KH5-1]
MEFRAAQDLVPAAGDRRRRGQREVLAEQQLAKLAATFVAIPLDIHFHGRMNEELMASLFNGSHQPGRGLHQLLDLTGRGGLQRNQDIRIDQELRDIPLTAVMRREGYSQV